MPQRLLQKFGINPGPLRTLLRKLRVDPGPPRRLLTRLRIDGAVRRARRTPPARLWIGDSQAVFLSGAPARRFALTPKGDGVVWLGPVLMYTIARDGLRDPLLPELRQGLNLTKAPIVLVAGGGDCRRQLVERLASGGTLDFVAAYVAQAAELRVRLGAPHVFLLGPVPPTDPELGSERYLHIGTLGERIDVTRRLENELCDAVARRGDPAVSPLLLGELLGDPRTGELASQFVHDGIHPNEAGCQRVRAELARAEAAVLAIAAS